MNSTQPLFLIKQIFSLLTPKDINNFAKQSHFIQRQRKFTSIKFLELILTDPAILAKKSLTSLCATLEDLNIVISKEGLNKKMNRNAVNFLQLLVQHVLENQINLFLNKRYIPSTITFSAIRILDGTSFKVSEISKEIYPGTTGAGVKIQYEYDYFTGKVKYIEIQAGKSADTPSGLKRLESVRVNELILQDLGYFQYKAFEKIDQANAFYISRCKADTMFYVDHPEPQYHKDGRIVQKYAHQRLFVEEEVLKLERGEMKEYPLIYLGKSARYPTRLIIYRMSMKEQERQQYRIYRRNQKKPGIIKQKSYDMSGVSTYITNLPLDTPAQEIINLYRYRWQIELVFRSWKTDFHLNHYRRMKVERLECHLYAQLLIMMLHLLITNQMYSYFQTNLSISLSEQITMRFLSDMLVKFWKARDNLELESLVKGLISKLARLAKKNLKK